MSERLCSAGHPMEVANRFRFDHEPGDEARATESLRLFEAAGIELGADVTVWRCAICGDVVADFAYPEAEA